MTQKFECAVRVMTPNGVISGVGWAGPIQAATPDAAAVEARTRHLDGPCRSYGEMIAHVEVWTSDMGLKIGDF